MKKNLSFLNSNVLLNICLCIFIFFWLFIIIIGGYQRGFKFYAYDDYVGLFNLYLQNGHYKSVVTGTSVLFNVVISMIFKFTNSFWKSVFILNFVSWVFILCYSFFLLKKSTVQKDKYFYIICSIFLFFVCNEKYYLVASNDFLQAVFILLFLNEIISLKKQSKIESFIKIGIFLGFAFSVRYTSLFLIPILFFKLAFYFVKNEESIFKKTTNLTLMIVVFSLIVGVFHYPSLKEKGVLSYEDKNRDLKLATWAQRNYLGLKKVQKDRFNRSAARETFTIGTPFTEADAYLIKNGLESLPKTHKEFLIKNPLLLIESTFWNIIITFIVYFKYWGFLFLLPLYFIIARKEKVFNKDNHPILFFYLTIFLVSLLCLTIIEMRWFVGYEILIPIAIINVLNKYKYFEYKNLLFSSSLLIITFFNLKLFISIYNNLLM